jgi:hypothetical protein
VKSIRSTKDGEDLIFPSQELPQFCCGSHPA